MLKQDFTNEFATPASDPATRTEMSAAEQRRRALAPTVFCPERDVVQCVSRLARQERRE